MEKYELSLKKKKKKEDMYNYVVGVIGSVYICLLCKTESIFLCVSI